MSQFVPQFTAGAIVGEPEVVEDGRAATALQSLQVKDGSVEQESDKPAAAELTTTIVEAVAELAPFFPHDASYLAALRRDFARWADEGFGVPDFLDALNEFQPQQHRVDGLGHLVVFPMYTQNGSTNRLVEAVLVEVIWPDFIAALEAGEYGNKLFVALRFVDFTPGYDTNSAVLFPETVAMREIPQFTWGAIFQDREAARYRRVVRAAAEITKLDLPEDAARMLDDQHLTEETFVMWDIIHDRSHMRGDLPFDPFMIKQRMPFFLYSLEELRCDLTAFRESVRLQRELGALPDSELSEAQREIRDHAKLVQYAVIFDRIFRFAITGSRVRNYRAALDRHTADDRLGRRPRCGRRAERPDQRAVLALHRPPEGGALARGVRDAHRDAHPAPGLQLGAGAVGRDPLRCAEGLHGRGPGRRVPAVDVLRGAQQEDGRCHRVDLGDHRHHGRRVTDHEGSAPARFSPEETGPTPAMGAAGEGALAGRLVLIAGATSASGEAVARALATAGATVLAVGTRQEALDALAAAVPGVDTRVCDLADRDAVAELAMRIHLKFGRVDGLVHLVGGWRGGGGIAGQSDEDWEFLERGFRTLRNTTGRLAIVSSTAVESPYAGGANYAAAKAAADAWTRAVAQGLAKQAPQSAAVVFVVKTLAGLEERLGESVVGLWAADPADVNGARIPL